MKVEYLVTERKIYLNGQKYTTYGIAAVNKASSNVDKSFSDISFDKAFVVSLAELLNTCEVELCHFDDVVIDELNRYSER